jgi:hypothetical protein
MMFGSVEVVLGSVRVRMFCSGVVRDARVVVSGVVSFLNANKGLVALAGRGRRAKAQRHQHPEASERGGVQRSLARSTCEDISTAYVK